MSTRHNGQIIRCDGADCQAQVRSVISLRPTPEQEREGEGWMYMQTGDTWRHYCPDCAPLYLKLQLIKDGYPYNTSEFQKD